MTAITDIVDSVHPAVSGIAVIVSDTIWVLFDREVDEQSVRENLFVEGPDQDAWSGPDLNYYYKRVSEGEEEDFLSSPNFRGFVQGEYSFEKINSGDLDTYTGWDYGGHGSIWRTKVVFTPDKALTPNTTYNVHLIGDENLSDDLDTGVRTRTVFDTVKGTNIGTGEASFTGLYTGAASSDTLHVKIYGTAGAAGTARFVWYRGSDIATVYGPFTAYRGTVTITDGVSIVFGDGTFEINDNFSVVVKTGTIYEGSLVWPFTTGSGSIAAVPSSLSTSVIGEPVAGTTTATTEFSVSSTSPENRATNLDTVVDAAVTVTINFSEDVDATTVSASTVTVNIEAVNGDESAFTASGLYTPTISVSGSAVALSIPSGIINENNVVTVTLDDSISSSDGTSLSEDYEFYFTSTYTPLYSSLRKVSLEYGAYLSNVPDDTINLAILEASLASGYLTWGPEITTLTYGTENSVEDYYQWARREFVTCKAAETLITNILGVGQGLKSKRLADFEVQYDTKALEQGLEKALGCLGKWEKVMNDRGLTVKSPTYVVKGEDDPNAPPVGRGWVAPNRGYPVATAKTQKSRRWISGYYTPSKGRVGK